jgi:23S rRNA (cytidine2498-2'-O)-methyltransferase
MPDPARRFLFVSCQPGAEAALKSELAREYPELRFAFSRPGFVTFKSPEELKPDLELRSVFAHAYGLSLGESKSPEDGVRADNAAALAREVSGGAPLFLHVWERESAEGESEHSEHVPLAPHAEVAVRDAAPDLFHPPRAPAPGDLVFDVILIEPAHWFFGFHRHGQAHSRDAGGMPALTLPSQAPSRAYLKLEEGLRWAGVELHQGERAIEIGSAPGGATYALLAKGLEVIGIDPAAMDPVVNTFGPELFRHVKKGVLDVAREDRLGKPDWILLDMNVPPQIALAALEHVLSLLPRSLSRGALLTLKLNRWRIADEIPDFLARIRKMGFKQVRATHLPSNRQEFFVCALSP